MRLLIIAFLFTVVFGSTQASAQEQAGPVASDTINLPGDTAQVPRPYIEIGTGPVTFYGDVGNPKNSHNPLVTNFGLHVALQAPINNFLSLELFAFTTRISANDYKLPNPTNFESRVNAGGARLHYDFSNFLPKETLIKPYVSVGIEALDFKTKTDLKDAQGRTYYYWTDGRIMSAPQNSSQAANAVPLQRDYVYETDIRKLNLDGLGNYKTSSFAVPVGVGATIQLNHALNIRFGSEMHFTFTDMIDNVSSSSVGSRKGNSANDRFLYSSVGISYNLGIKKQKKKPVMPSISGEKLLAADMADQDDDGVADIIDQCPNTPAGVKVNEFGCPLDKDKDGVPDYLDKEVNSPPGSVVDKNGVALSDEDLHNRYLAFIDSLNTPNIVRSSMETADIKRLKGRSNFKGYHLIVDSTKDISTDQISALLSVSDVRAYKDSSGSGQYLVGNYVNLKDAVRRMIALDKDHIHSKLVYDNFGDIKPVANQDSLMVGVVQQLAAGEDEGANGAAGKMIFRVQIGAYRYPLSKDVFKNVPDLLTIKGNDGLTRYLSGSFKTINAAAKHKVDLLLDGFEGAFIVAYRNGKRISLKDAGARIEGKENFNPNDVKSDLQIDKSKISFAVQLGSFMDKVPANTLSSYMSLKNVKPVRTSEGVTKYIYGNYKSFEEAVKERDALISKGYKGAFVVGYFNGSVISSDEAKRMLK